MIRNVFVFLVFFLCSNLIAQYTISGTVSNQKGEPLIGANIIIQSLDKGVTTNTSGSFTIADLPAGEYDVLVSYLGYADSQQQINLSKNSTLNFELSEEVISGEEIIVRSTRAGYTTPTTFTEVSKEDITANNLGQDMPFLFGMEPSLVTTSDAGAGVGYTGLWIRGSNIQRINVTVNGIPLNDPESHGVFFVNMPDFSSSLESAQIQRGVGTSTNGGGAFGATINLETSQANKKAFGEINSSIGSFNTFKNNVRFGTGLIKDKWAFEGRLSKITSDGYVDRASSDLQSFFLQGGYYGEKTTVKAVVFSGKEKTYQAWWGVDDWTIENLGRTYNWAGVIYNEDGTERYYDNQTDNYQQDHYQLHLTQKVSDVFSFNLSGHYTYGRGYYEEYNQGEFLGDYPIGVQYFGLDSNIIGSEYEYFYHDTIQYGDVITRRWLDNHFYGATYSFDFDYEKINLTLGGAINKYGNARHFGEVIWAQFTGDTDIREPYYDNTSNKTDFNSYLKIDYSIFQDLNLFVDMQFREVIYKANGTDNGDNLINIDQSYSFINPKVGVSYLLPVGIIYGSFAVSNREPIRTDFLDAPEGITPEPETLQDIELGIRKNSSQFFYSANIYYMRYKNQLVLTGEINDVGAPIRANVGESERYGLELDGGAGLAKWFSFRANASLSSSRTDYKTLNDEGAIVEYNNVQLSYSPQVIFGAEALFKPVKNMEGAVIAKHVSKQYLDLTANDEFSLDAYTTLNLRLGYSLSFGSIEELRFSLLVNNLLDAMYASNGYVWGVPYYYPQAGRNYLAGISIKF